ncbi:MAG: tRNA (N6-isopentenyl adenosine(37)-C2)-methylthiotransferase MiaB [Syntrophales bacterium]
MKKRQKYLYIHTFGCQMNVHDSELMADMMKKAGYLLTPDVNEADVIIVNTCSIRQKAAQKAYSQLGRFRELKRRKPGVILAVGGCLAQQWGERFFDRIPEMDIIFGTHQIHQVPEMISAILEDGCAREATDFADHVRSLDLFPVPEDSRVNAFVTIMQGCNNFCSYCVVPYVRGREESRPMKDVIEEVRILADRGIKEVVLLGQNVNSYGQTLINGTNFPSLLRAIDTIEGIERIRFTTSHPKDLSPDLIGCFHDIESLCEYIHLPVQSGSDQVLERMNRGYTASDYIRKIEQLHASRPDIAISTDIIVGFPGESEEDFQVTIGLMEKIKFDNVYSFKYSEREGTEAAALDRKVSDDTKANRLKILQALQDRHTFNRNEALVGGHAEVLVEGLSRNSHCDVTGRTRTNKIVNLEGDPGLIGKTVMVGILKAHRHSLRGEIVP